MRLITLILVFLCFSITVNAAELTENQLNDDSTFETIALKYLGLQEDDCATNLIVQKKLPDTDKIAIVIPEYISASRDEYEGFDINLHVLLIDTINEEVIAYYPNKFVETSDAIRLDSISIDTGLFMLNEENRAFGIVIHHSNSRSTGHYTSSTMSLFIQKDKILQRVLDDLITSYDQGEYYGCEGELETGKSILIISNQQTNNFNNIIVKNTGIQTVIEKDKNTTEDDKACSERSENFKNQYTLKYTNGKYQKVD